MLLQRLDHVGLNVTNLERSAEWYQRVLGFEIIHKFSTTWMVGAGTIRVGLFHRLRATPVEDLDNRVACTHVAILTDMLGFAASQAWLASQGVVFEGPDDSGIASSVFFKDPDGHEWEITAYHGEPGSNGNAESGSTLK